MTDLEHIRAKFAAEYGLSEDMLRNAERWTETTGDLEGVPENLLPGILGMRFGAIAIDTPRSERWSTPEDIDVIAESRMFSFSSVMVSCIAVSSA